MPKTTEILTKVDHLILAAPDLEASIEYIANLLGIQATIGGSHIGWGTRNALLALGPAAYLEIIAPDPAQTSYRQPRIFGIDDLAAPRLVTWAAKTDNLEAIAGKELGGELKLGEAISASRKKPDGSELTWQFSDPFTGLAEGLVPFFINWGESLHPSAQAAAGATLVGFRAEHPTPEDVRGLLTQLDLSLPVSAGSETALVATINCPKGTVELR